MARHDALPASIAPRGLCRAQAAQYVGVSATTFDRMVDEGRMPPPKKIAARRVWDRVAIDHAFEDLPSDEANPWDGAT